MTVLQPEDADASLCYKWLKIQGLPPPRIRQLLRAPWVHIPNLPPSVKMSRET